MIDKNLLRLLGGNKKYIFYTVALMVLGLFANIGITASICWAVSLAIYYDEYSGGVIRILCKRARHDTQSKNQNYDHCHASNERRLLYHVWA